MLGRYRAPVRSWIDPIGRVLYQRLHLRPNHLTVLGLAWRREDPLAVRLTLAAQPDHPALPRGEWSVLRDFLRYGVEEPTGDV